jgi:hypothetical protein
MNIEAGAVENAKLTVLRSLELGARTAEEEAGALIKYFVETDQWKRMLNGRIDVVYGAKGAGKSAIYTLLGNAEKDLRSAKIITVTAENPRGATVFRNIASDPPASEREFITLWKIYLVCLLGKALQETDNKTERTQKFVDKLVGIGLLPPGGGLARLFRAARELAQRLFRAPKTVTWTATVEPSTGIIIPSRTAEYGPEIQTKKDLELDEFSPDDALEEADRAFAELGMNCWVLFDRLDVAFEETRELEKNALRALFRAYNDLKGLNNIALKIFVRSDIWRRITEVGFAEASHITRTVTIRWDNESLLNLAVRRLLNNKCVVDLLAVDPAHVLKSLIRQREIFYKLFPRQIDSGPNKPDTFEWMLGRTKDGTGGNAPRELIHFMTEIRDEQIRRLERGEALSADSVLFDRSIFKVALKAVSETRLNQTFLAEYPELRQYVMALHREKTLHNLDTLGKIWNMLRDEVVSKAAALVAAGFFEVRGTKDDPEFWVPFLYRDALEMVQGTAD